MTVSTTSQENDSAALQAAGSSWGGWLNRHQPALEVLAAILLGLATLATSWSGYQASRWGGVQSALYSQASALRVESSRAQDEAGHFRTIDVLLFGDWLNAYSDRDFELADFYQQRFREAFVPAFDAWMASQPLVNLEAASSPFALPEYTLEEAKKAQELEAQATAKFVEGQAANEVSNNYVLNAVLLALVLFLAGNAQRFHLIWVRMGMLGAAAIILCICLYNIVVYPIQ